MPRGRKPEGERPLSHAERQARYRSRHHGTQSAAVTRPRKAADRRSRPQRWNAAVAELLTLQADYTAWLEALPEALQGTPAAEALRAVVDLDLETLANIELPRGYGRD